MAGGLCRLSQEAQREIQKVLDTNTNEYAVLLKCITQTNSLDVDFVLENTDIAEIASELSDTLPRIILFRTKLSVDDQSKINTPLAIYFNPPDTPGALKGTYKNSFKELERQSTNFKSMEINDVSDFRPEIIHAKAMGLTGAAAPGLVAVKEVYGRQLI